MKRQILPHPSSRRLLLLIAIFLMSANSVVRAQTTTFTYQGRLTDGGTPATGNYDLQFALFDSASSGGQVGSTQTVPSVPVSSGIFTVSLDFGAGAFSGANRFLEMSARLSGSGSFTLLAPRQQITATPYAVRSLLTNAADALTGACVGCVQDANINAVAGTKVSGTIPVAGVPAGSTSYVQNTSSPQSNSNFNISGTGTANILNAATQYNLGGSRMLSMTGAFNTFVGAGTGPNNTGSSNAFFGSNAGLANSSGSGNSFFGTSAGNSNTTGGGNSFFGNRAGQATTAGDSNSFFGDQAGSNNTAAGNSFFGRLAGNLNSTGSFNSFFGTNAGQTNNIGIQNSFFGYNAGANAGGSQANFNSFFGAAAGQNSVGCCNAFFGSSAGMNTTAGFNAFFGLAAGQANTTGTANAFFGANAGHLNTAGITNAFFGNNTGPLNTTGNGNSFFGNSAGVTNTTGSNNTVIGAEADVGANNLTNATAIGAGAVVSSSNTIMLGRTTGTDTVSIPGILNAGTISAFTQYNIAFNRMLGIGPVDSVFVGLGSGTDNTGAANSFFGSFSGNSNNGGVNNSFFGHRAGFANTTGDNNTMIGANADLGASNLTYATAIGAGAFVGSSNTIVLGRSDGSDFVRVPGFLTIPNLAAAGSTQLCRNAFDRIGACSSSLRYKTNLAPYRSGLNIINRLRPISFTWKEGGMRDVGFGAEDVEQIDPLLVTYNQQGQVEGVKYDRINVVLVNAIREQQDQIERQHAEHRQQQNQIEALRTANVALNARLRDIEKVLRQSLGASRRRR